MLAGQRWVGVLRRLAARRACLVARTGASSRMSMDKVFVYWDNSNIFISAREVVAQREGEGARARVQIHFRNLLEFARAGRPVKRALAVGPVPPELRHVWNSLENEGVEVRLLERGSLGGGRYRQPSEDHARTGRLTLAERWGRANSTSTGSALQPVFHKQVGMASDGFPQICTKRRQLDRSRCANLQETVPDGSRLSGTLVSTSDAPWGAMIRRQRSQSQRKDP